MPELPEVETTVRLLAPQLLGRRIERVDVLWPRTLGGTSPATFARAVSGASIEQVWRRAKYVVMDLSRGDQAAGNLYVHLRMSGRLLVRDATEASQKHDRLVMQLDRGALVFLDVRKFGRFCFTSNLDAVFAELGVEPLSAAFTPELFAELLGSRKRLLKPLLLDQSVVAGLGNIYVDESLHRARLHPLRSSASLSTQAVARLHEAVQAVLSEAIAQDGASFDSFYRTPEGKPGNFQHLFKAYGRDGQPCFSCGRPIRKIVVAQRGTHVCPRCQPPPRHR